MAWYSFFVYIFITSFSPGPNNIMSMTNAARVGLKRSIWFNVGIFAGFVIIIPLCAAFSTVLYEYIPAIKPYMLVIGAAYMLYMAYKIWKSGAHIEKKDSTTTFWAGLALQFINPKLYIYSITLMSAYILPHYRDWPHILGFSLIIAIIPLLSTLTWAACGALLIKLMTKYSKWVNAVLAALLVYCAIALFM